MCAHRLADQGKLDFDAPVAKYWPEFAAAGKGNRFPSTYLLNHKAGIAAIRAPLKLDDIFSWEKVTDRTRAPGAVVEAGHQARLSRDHFRLAGRRGRAPHQRQESRHLLPRRDRRSARRRRLYRPSGRNSMRASPISSTRLRPSPASVTLFVDMHQGPGSVSADGHRQSAHDASRLTTINSRAWRGAEIPGANGHSNARALARIYGALPAAAKLTASDLLARASCRALLHRAIQGTRRGAAASPPASASALCSPSPASQYGSQSAQLRPSRRRRFARFRRSRRQVGFGYVMNQMGTSR